jgi:hypothetical protein
MLKPFSTPFFIDTTTRFFSDRGFIFNTTSGLVYQYQNYSSNSVRIFSLLTLWYILYSIYINRLKPDRFSFLPIQKKFKTLNLAFAWHLEPITLPGWISPERCTFALPQTILHRTEPRCCQN